MEFNWAIPFIAAIIPILIGAIWYQPKLFGNALMKSIKSTDEEMKSRKKLLIVILGYICGLMISFAVMPMVIHQMHIMSVLANDPTMADPNSESSLYVKHFFEMYGANFRTFKHGAFHGTLTALMFVLPIVSIIALFEKKRFKYVAIHTGYWLVTLALMGGVICQWL